MRPMFDLRMMAMMMKEAIAEMLPENPVKYGETLDVKKLWGKVLSSLMASHTGSPVIPAQSPLRSSVLAETRGTNEQNINSCTKQYVLPLVVKKLLMAMS